MARRRDPHAQQNGQNTLPTMNKRSLSAIVESFGDKLLKARSWFSGVDEGMLCIYDNWVDELNNRKRKFAGDPTSPPSKKQRGERESAVEKIYPRNGRLDWYRGGNQKPFYVRQCVKDILKVILKAVEAAKRRKGTYCCVVSGAAGIGKSWSINQFVIELLDLGYKVIFHSGEEGSAYEFSANEKIRRIDPMSIGECKDLNTIYVFASPGEKAPEGSHRSAKLRLNGVTLIFSSPKIKNYNYAVAKSDGHTVIMNLPTWKLLEMLNAICDIEEDEEKGDDDDDDGDEEDGKEKDTISNSTSAASSKSTPPSSADPISCDNEEERNGTDGKTTANTITAAETYDNDVIQQKEESTTNSNGMQDDARVADAGTSVAASTSPSSTGTNSNDNDLALKAEQAKARYVKTSYSLWGGNMRACAQFVERCNCMSAEEAKKMDLLELNTQIALLDENIMTLMAEKLTKQKVGEIFDSTLIADSPGHILVPYPECTDPNQKRCFQDFRWRFCSPVVEKKFWDRIKAKDKGILMNLLKKVFEVPCSKGILFEKVSHSLITNGAVDSFKCYSFSKKDEGNKTFEKIVFPACNVNEFKTCDLSKALEVGIAELKKCGVGGGEPVAIALEPEDPSFDAVDMFVLVKTRNGDIDEWRLYLLQDTIARDHSLHPVKVLWYCALFCDAFKNVFPGEKEDSELLKCCEYIAITPFNKENVFKFQKPENTSNWDELDRVAKLLKFTWPGPFTARKPAQNAWENLIVENDLEIPKTKKGEERKPNKTVVGNALLLRGAAEKVKARCRVIIGILDS